MNTTTMTEQLMVANFHKKYGHPAPSEPTTISSQRANFRIALLDEEITELAEAYWGWAEGRTDIKEVIDALGDILYVTLGGFVEIGVDAGPFFDAIHVSNLSKDPNPEFTGKPVKGSGYQPPALGDVYRELYGSRQPKAHKD